jgi:predicted outer membrane protein
VSAHRYIVGVLQNTLIPAATTPRYKSFLESAHVTIKEHEIHSEHWVHELG